MQDKWRTTTAHKFRNHTWKKTQTQNRAAHTKESEQQKEEHGLDTQRERERHIKQEFRGCKINQNNTKTHREKVSAEIACQIYSAKKTATPVSFSASQTEPQASSNSCLSDSWTGEN